MKFSLYWFGFSTNPVSPHMKCIDPSNGTGIMFAQSNGANEVMHALTLQSATRSAYVFNSGLRNAIYQFRVMNPAGGVFQQYLLNPLHDHLMLWSLP